VQLNAVTSGVAQIRKVLAEAKEQRDFYGKKTIFFIDEIHRFNRSQQDALLPAVESGLVILIGATTENPFFEVNSPLLSRSRIFRLESLKPQDIEQILKQALADRQRGLGLLNVELTSEAMDHLVNMADGDARTALNALELAALTTEPKDGRRLITDEIAAESIQRKILQYDKTGDNHYDTVSAFIKSMRGSDPDAAVFWLAKMLQAGEDPRFIARRMVILAAEDVGLADPQALLVANSAAGAVEFVGMPEAQIPLAQAAIYLATAPKSNAAYLAINAANRDLKNIGQAKVPLHLRDGSYRGAEKLGSGKGYLYPHDYPGHWVKQQYLPDALVDRRYYQPSEEGYEAKIRDRIKEQKKTPPTS
jgi:putative ATPase